MDHTDHVALIRNGLPGAGGVWADLGSGEGAFTLALRDVTGPTVQIYSVDKNSRALANQRQSFDRRYPDTKIRFIQADFTQPLQLPPLDGIVMANSLHFVPYAKQEPLLRRLRTYLKPGGKLIIVEYNTDKGNLWVPYPLSMTSFSTLAQKSGWSQPHLIGRIPSSFLGEIYSAVTSAGA